MDFPTVKDHAYDVLSWMHTLSQSFMYIGVGYLALKLAGVV